jgi:endoglucanase
MFKHLSAVFVASAQAELALVGVSQAGAEFGENVPGIPETDFTFPNPDSIQHLTSLGFGATRVPFLWERLQPDLQKDFDTAYFANLTATVSTIKAAGGTAILDPHNYARYGGKVIGDGVAVEDFLTELLSGE